MTPRTVAAALQDLKARHREVMQEVLMDVLRALSSPNMDIRKKTLDIALDLITARNIDEVRCGTHLAPLYIVDEPRHPCGTAAA